MQKIIYIAVLAVFCVPQALAQAVTNLSGRPQRVVFIYPGDQAAEVELLPNQTYRPYGRVTRVGLADAPENSLIRAEPGDEFAIWRDGHLGIQTRNRPPWHR